MPIAHTRPYRGATNEWQTPPEIIKALGPFDDDPARPGEIDGFFRPWRGLVWLNPPYGPEVGDWVEKMAHHGNGLLMVFARTETRWFRWVWESARSILFVQGRPHFYRNGIRAKGNSGGPLIIAAFGEEAHGRLSRCGLPGSLVTGWSRNA